MIIAIFLSLLLYYILFKIWSSGVKAVGRGIIFVIKPVYKFLFKVFSLTIVIATVLIVLLTVGLAINMVTGTNDNGEKNEIVESVEETEQEQDRNFLERFGDRAIKRVDKFGNYLMSKTAAINKKMGLNENGEFEGSGFVLILYTFSLLILLPFILALLIIALLFVSMMELLAITLLLDMVILVIRLFKSRCIVETVKEWWEWAIE